MAKVFKETGCVNVNVKGQSNLVYSALYIKYSFVFYLLLFVLNTDVKCQGNVYKPLGMC